MASRNAGSLTVPRSFPPAWPAVILPLALPPSAPPDRTSLWVGVVGRLKTESSLEDASAQLAALSRQLESEFPRSNLASEYFPDSLREALVGKTRPALILLLSAVGVVLLIACVNVAHLMLGWRPRSTPRGRCQTDFTTADR